MSTKRILTTTTAIAALATAGVAGAAEAPVVSEQHFVAGKAPLTIPGTGVKKGEYMGAKAQLVFRNVTLEGDQEVRLSLRARNGRTIRGLAIPEGSKVSFQPVDRGYVGDRRVVVTAEVAPTAGDEEVTGRIYALTR
jgi:hypothetical protein